MWRDRIAFERLRQAFVHIRINITRGRRPQPKLNGFSRETCETHSFGHDYRATNEIIENLGIQLRSERQGLSWRLHLPRTNLEKRVTRDSERISAAIIANHTDYEKTRNLQRRPCLSKANTFVPDGPAMSSRGQTSWAAPARSDNALDIS